MDYGNTLRYLIMGILSRIILIILVIVFFLAILGLGWNTFFEGIKKGADKLGITSIIENATGSATEMYKSISLH
jgi:uncharacterized membrane protein